MVSSSVVTWLSSYSANSPYFIFRWIHPITHFQIYSTASQRRLVQDCGTMTPDRNSLSMTASSPLAKWESCSFRQVFFIFSGSLESVMKAWSTFDLVQNCLLYSSKCSMISTSSLFLMQSCICSGMDFFDFRRELGVFFLFKGDSDYFDPLSFLVLLPLATLSLL